jgi:CRP-like cAMP-binding protein
MIMRRGETGQSMFVLLRGSVRIETPNPDGSPDALSVASVGDLFGLAAMMCGRPRVATATAIGAVELLALDWVRLQHVARLFPRSAYVLFKNLSVIMGERLSYRSLPLSENALNETSISESVTENFDQRMRN